MNKLQLVSVNARGLNTDEKRLKLYEWLRDTGVDIALIQETHYVEKNILKYDSRWFGKSVHGFSDSCLSKGVSILFKKDIPLSIFDSHRSIDGRKLLVNLKYEEITFSIVNVYAPNYDQQRLEFFKRLKSFIFKYSVNIENVAVCGDFNCNIENTSDKSSEYLKHALKSLEMYDAWRHKHNTLNGYTWCNGEDIPSSRIDYVFISKNFVFDFENIIIRRIPGTHSSGKRMSDHRVLKFCFNISCNKRGSGYWKLNSTYLENETYKVKVKEIISEIYADQSYDSLTKWEVMKTKVKDFSIDFSREYQYTLKKKINTIENELSYIENSHFQNIDMNRKRQLEAELSNIYDSKCKGAFIRSRSHWIKEGERNTKFFFFLV